MKYFYATKELKQRYKAVLSGAFFWGILSNGMGLFNKYSYHDDINNLFKHQGSAAIGRWMLKILDKCENLFFGDINYSLPLINGTLAILFIALAACVIVTLLDIKNNMSCFCLAGIMVVFPVVTSLFGYLYTIHFYMFGMLLGLIGTYLVCRSYKWYLVLIGIIFIGGSIGVYQAFIPLNLSVMAIYFLLFILKPDEVSFKDIVKKASVLIGSVIGSLCLYFTVNNFFLSISGENLTDYQGISSMGKSGITEYLYRAVDAYRLFFFPSEESSYYMYPDRIRMLYMLTLVVSLFIIVMWIKHYPGLTRIRSVCAYGVTLLIPLCVNFVFVMAGESMTHALMVYAQCVPFIIIICLVQKYPFKVQKMKKYSAIALSTAALVLNFMYCRYDNKCYLKASYVQAEAISYFTTLVTRIKSTEGYKDEYPVLYVNPGNISDLSLEKQAHFSEIRNDPYWDLDRYVNDFAWIRFMGVWCGYAPKYSIIETKDCVEQQILDMASYPDDGSIKVIGETVVVKFQDQASIE